MFPPLFASGVTLFAILVMKGHTRMSWRDAVVMFTAAELLIWTYHFSL